MAMLQFVQTHYCVIAADYDDITVFSMFVPVNLYIQACLFTVKPSGQAKMVIVGTRQTVHVASQSFQVEHECPHS